LLLVAAAVLNGCAAYEGSYQFEPHPAEVTATMPGEADAQPVRILVSILGVKRPAEGDPDDRPALEIRLRVENTSTLPVTFDPGTLVLFSGANERFPDPKVASAQRIMVAPGGNAVVDACFPFPGDGTPEATDMSGLNLRWTVVIDGKPVSSSASFLRQQPDDDDAYPHRGIGVGYHRYPC
jgi:hypothetical protein